MDRYENEYVDYEIPQVRAGKRAKRKNHKMNSRGLRDTQRIILEKANAARSR